ncbi:MAG TPA: nucleoside recognition domain-containing protein [Bacilli bacterium]
MDKFPAATAKKSVTALFGAAVVAFVILIILFPSRAFQASLYGLQIWWEILFPSLLPVFVLTEMLFAFGIVRALGVLADPFMRFAFRLPGECGLAFAAGLIAGYPAGADVAGRLFRRKLLTPGETERVVAMSHIAGPMWVFTAISVGFLHRAELGAVLFLAQAASAIAIGLFGRFAANMSGEKHLRPADRPPLLKSCLTAIREVRNEDGRAFGKILGDAVLTAAQNLFVIGGTMMIAAVFLEMLRMAGLFSAIAGYMAYAFRFAGLPGRWAGPILTGAVEANLGVFAIGQDISSTQLAQTAIAAGILAWSGFAVHAQVKSIVGANAFHYGRFLLARLVHAALAFLFTLLLYRPITHWLYGSPGALQAFRAVVASPNLSAAASPLFAQGAIWLLGLSAAVSWLVFLLASAGFIRMCQPRPK